MLLEDQRTKETFSLDEGQLHYVLTLLNLIDLEKGLADILLKETSISNNYCVEFAITLEDYCGPNRVFEFKHNNKTEPFINRSGTNIKRCQPISLSNMKMLATLVDFFRQSHGISIRN